MLFTWYSEESRILNTLRKMSDTGPSFLDAASSCLTFSNPLMIACISSANDFNCICKIRNLWSLFIAITLTITDSQKKKHFLFIKSADTLWLIASQIQGLIVDFQQPTPLHFQVSKPSSIDQVVNRTKISWFNKCAPVWNFSILWLWEVAISPMVPKFAHFCFTVDIYQRAKVEGC